MVEKQSILIAKVIDIESKNNHANNGHDNTRLLLSSFKVDQSTSKVNSTKLGTNSIIVRQDLINDLTSIKNILNSYGIPLSCDFINISIDNDNISDIARLGLEINLNSFSALTTKSDLWNDDYFVGPDFNKPHGVGYKLKVYAQCRNSNPDKNTRYTQLQHPVDVYDIRSTYSIYPPKIKKLFKPLIDLTQIFGDHGFKQHQPNKQFFYKSDNLESNWFAFYKPFKINIGDTYLQHLSKVYDNNNESIWQNKELKWDGEKFV